MKTCTICGREVDDDVERCPVDGAPLTASGGEGAEPPRRRVEIPLGEGVAEEDETVVRARKAVPIPPADFTRRPVVTSASSAPRPAGPVVVPSADPGPQTLWPAVVTIALLAAAAVGGLLFYIFSEQYTTAATVSTQITDARVAVADARARIESLPPEHLLRRRILDLDKWDRELQGFETSSEKSSEMAIRAKEIATNARNLAEDARAAGAPVPTTPPVPPPAVVPPANANVGLPPSGDPMVRPEEAPTAGGDEEPATPTEKRPGSDNENSERPEQPEAPAKPPATNTSPEVPLPKPEPPETKAPVPTPPAPDASGPAGG